MNQWTADPFVPRRRLGNGHVMTIYAWASRREFPRLPPPEARLFQVLPDTQVLAHCYWQPDRAKAPTILGLHGLESSSDAHYMRGLADKAFARGWNVVLLNQRNCGGTENLTPRLYHSGLTDDAHALMGDLAARDGIRWIGVVGYSLGGNLAVKLAAEVSDGAPSPVRAVVAVSPTIDLASCVEAIERTSNYPYQWNFVRNLKARMRRKAALWPGRFDLSRLDDVWTIRQFDETFTAPHHGFAGASDYYHRASAVRVVDRIRLPALLVTADDDPFVPPDPFDQPVVRAHTTVRIERGGGHCGFVSTPGDGFDGYWAETAAVNFLTSAYRTVEHT
jgi:predicted alpha/beta-fold hydrolase